MAGSIAEIKSKSKKVSKSKESKSKNESKYRVTFELGKDLNGNRIREYYTVSTREDAVKLLNELEYNQNKNLMIKTAKMSFVEFLNYWMDNYVRKNCEVTTIYGYNSILSKHVKNFFGAIELQKLLPMHIQNYYMHLMDEKNLSPNTIHKHHAIIRKALDFGLKQQLVHRNVADAVMLPKRKRFEGTSYTKSQLHELLDKAKGTKLEVPICLAVYLGLRREEISGLKWKYVNFEEHVLHIVEVRTSAGKDVITKGPKTDKSRRTLHIDDVLCELLLKHKAKQTEYKRLLGKDYIDEDYVCAHENGKPYRVNSVTEQFKAFLEKEQLLKIRLHDLRHTFASILYDEGVDLKAISEALGHSDIGTTNKIYTHRFDKTHKGALETLGRVLNVSK